VVVKPAVQPPARRVAAGVVIGRDEVVRVDTRRGRQCQLEGRGVAVGRRAGHVQVKPLGALGEDGAGRLAPVDIGVDGILGRLVGGRAAAGVGRLADGQQRAVAVQVDLLQLQLVPLAAGACEVEEEARRERIGRR